MSAGFLNSAQDVRVQAACPPKQKVKYLAVICSDPFYHQAFEEFLSRLGGLYTVFAEPGAGLQLVKDWHRPEDEGSIIWRIRKLAKELGVEEMVVINHAECAAYDAEYGESGLDQAGIDGLAKGDLETLQAGFSDKFPEIRKLYTFFAFKDKGQVRFIRI